MSLSPGDPTSYSRPDFAIVRHIHLELNVDMKKKVLSGSATYNIDIINCNEDVLLLDVSDLNIEAVFYKKYNDKVSLDYTVSDFVKNVGSKLAITLPKDRSNKIKLVIEYSNSPEATGLLWLTPEQTSGKKHPYMFSQFQGIHARSVLPCQDSPSVKCTYTALLTHPPELVVLMSAIRSVKGPSVTWFEQAVPLPSYLIAIAVGDLVSRELSPISSVWTEQDQLEACVYEFAETPMVLKLAEDICGPYVWGRYDLLVLPPSFAYGGMENPCLTFVTPTVLAGDRSLAYVIAHEAAHSWTGNLVTNRNFEHFWLNEGFTIFVEGKIVGRMQGDKFRDFKGLCNLTVLKEEVNRLGADNDLTCLVVDLAGRNPDDSFSTIPYMKGSLFLCYLEQLLGGTVVFEDFLKKYLDNFKFKSIDTDDFKNFLLTHFKDNSKLSEIDWDTWLHKPGMPPVIPNYDATLANVCKEVADAWLNWNETSDRVPDGIDKNLKKLSSSQLIEVLSGLLPNCPLSITKLEKMANIHNLNETNNCDVKYLWLCICLKSHWEEKIAPALEFVTAQGRMRYLRPIYRNLFAWDLSRNLAVEHFQKTRHAMMSMAAYTVAKDMQIE